MIYRNLLVKSIDSLIENKNHENTQYLGALTDGSKRTGKINCEAGELLYTIKKQILLGDFTAIQKDGEYTVEIPVSSSKTLNDVTTNYKNSVFRIHPEYSRQFTITAGGLEEEGIVQANKAMPTLPALSEKIGTIRQDNHANKEQQHNRPNLAII